MVGGIFKERNRKMNLNLSNITNRFSQISGVIGEDLSRCADFIAYGKYTVEKLIVKLPTDEEIPICEYCAACFANYSYVCALLSTPEKYVTVNGVRSSSKPESSLLSSARLLKEQAVASISHLTADCNFAFSGVGE